MKSKRYAVEEKLVGTAYYEVEATSKREALQKVRSSGVSMVDHKITHTGRGKVTLIEDSDGA